MRRLCVLFSLAGVVCERCAPSAPTPFDCCVFHYILSPLLTLYIVAVSVATYLSMQPVAAVGMWQQSQLFFLVCASPLLQQC